MNEAQNRDVQSGGLWKVTDSVDEVLNRIEQQKEPELPEGIMALELLQLAYRGKIKLTPQQARCAIESLPYETPKLSATAIATMNGEDPGIEGTVQQLPEQLSSLLKLPPQPNESVDQDVEQSDDSECDCYDHPPPPPTKRFPCPIPQPDAGSGPTFLQ